MTLLDRKLQCPNCSVEMQIVQKNEIDIDYCPGCKGVVYTFPIGTVGTEPLIGSMTYLDPAFPVGYSMVG